MTTHPEMISGPGEFDCRLMRTMNGKMVCKRGAEGYQALGIMPGVIAAGRTGCRNCLQGVGRGSAVSHNRA